MNNKNQMSEAARAARREYNRQYYQKNKERIARQRAKYWERVAAELAAAKLEKQKEK